MVNCAGNQMSPLDACFALPGSRLLPDRRRLLNALRSALSANILSKKMECHPAAPALLALHPTPAQRLRRWPSTPPAPHFAIHVCLEPGPAVTMHRVRFALLEYGVE